MDLQKLKSHIDGSYHQDINPTLEKDNSNLSAFFCADVVGAKRFVLNRGGYPMSEIAQINAASDLNQQINLLNQLQDYSPTENPTAGMSDAEIMLGHRSKYCQTASEQIGWLQDLIHNRDMQRAAANPPQENKINFENNEKLNHD